MPSTIFLQPLDLCNLQNIEIEHLEANLKRITDLLSSMKLGNEIEINFDNFLQTLGLTIDAYILSIRYSLQRDTILLTPGKKYFEIARVRHSCRSADN